MKEILFATGNATIKAKAYYEDKKIGQADDNGFIEFIEKTLKF